VAKRQHGYYALPILFGDRLVGRIEPRLSRERAALRIVGLSFERGFAPVEDPSFVAGLGRAIEAYRRFTGAERVLWPRSRVARALAAACGGVESRAP
jgi:uncharacterized protein YcaQ